MELGPALELRPALLELAGGGVSRILVESGGGLVGRLLRERLLDACVADGLRAFLPSRAMCTDNAAMVAAAGWYRLRADGPSPLDTGADPNLKLVSTLS